MIVFRFPEGSTLVENSCCWGPGLKTIRIAPTGKPDPTTCRVYVDPAGRTRPTIGGLVGVGVGVGAGGGPGPGSPQLGCRAIVAGGGGRKAAWASPLDSMGDEARSSRAATAGSARSLPMVSSASGTR